MKKATKINFIVGIILVIILVIVGVVSAMPKTYSSRLVEIPVYQNSKLSVVSNSQVMVSAMGHHGYFMLYTPEGNFVEGSRYIGDTFIGKGMLHSGNWALLNGDANLQLVASEQEPVKVQVTLGFWEIARRVLLAFTLLVWVMVATILITSRIKDQ